MNKKLYFSLMFVFFVLLFINSSYATTIDFSTTSNNNNVIGYQTTNFHKMGQTFTGNDEYLISVPVYYYKSGSPTDNITISIQTDSGGNPDGITLVTGTFVASDVTDTVSPADYLINLTMNDSLLINSGTTYWIVFERTGSLSTTDWVALSNQNGNPYVNGSFYTYENSVWSILTGYDLKGSIYTTASIGATPTINHNITDYYNSENISISLNTSSNVNMSYVLDGGSETSICTDCNSSTLNLNSLSESSHSITLIANDITGETNTSVNFTVDTTTPTINNNILTEYNYYTFNFNSSCNDTNLDYCNISINSQNILLNTSSFTATVNGNLSYNITARDLAGNTATDTGVLLLNPYQTIWFKDSSGSFLEDFFIDSISYSSNYTFLLFDYGYGDQSIEFSKDGYLTQSINFNLNTTSDLNQTYTINYARILIYVRDKITGSLITDNVTAEFVATVGLTSSSTTGLFNITNTLFEDEEYLVALTSTNYETESIYFDFNNRELITLNAYLVESNETNLGAVFIKTVDLFGQVIEGATVKALQWDSATSTYKEVSQTKTGSDGLGTLNVILNDKIYIFTGIYNGYVQNTSAEIIDTTENGKTITITLRAETQEYNYLFENVITNVTESFNNNTNISTITFIWEDTQGYSREVCINSYRYMRGTESQLTESCTSGVSGQYILNFDINASYTTILKAEIKEGGRYYTIDSFIYLPEGNIPDLLGDLGVAIFIVPLLFIGAIALGMMIENTIVATGMLMLLAGLSLYIAPTILTKGIVAFLFFMGWLTVNYGVKSR